MTTGDPEGSDAAACSLDAVCASGDEGGSLSGVKPVDFTQWTVPLTAAGWLYRIEERDGRAQLGIRRGWRTERLSIELVEVSGPEFGAERLLWLIARAEDSFYVLWAYWSRKGCPVWIYDYRANRLMRFTAD